MEKVSILLTAISTLFNSIALFSICMHLNLKERDDNANKRSVEFVPEDSDGKHYDDLPKTNDTSSTIGNILIKKDKYVNQEHALVTVSFQLYDHDWLKLEKSDVWSRIELQLQEIQSKHNQKFHLELR